MAGEAEQMASVVHEFVHIGVAAEHRRSTLVQADEVEHEEGEESGRRQPDQGLGGRDGCKVARLDVMPNHRLRIRRQLLIYFRIDWALSMADLEVATQCFFCTQNSYIVLNVSGCSVSKLFQRWRLLSSCLENCLRN